MEVVSEKSVKTLNLENRLIDFAVLVLEISDNLPGKRSYNHLGDQLLRSGRSPSLNCGEAQFATKEITELVNIFTKSAKTATENKVVKR